MLNISELKTLMLRLGLPPKGQALVMKARGDSPVRKVTSSGQNVVTHYFSRKMGRVVSTESRSAEQAGAYLYEFDPVVLEYWPQPMIVDVQRPEIDGKKATRFSHYPDFLVITKECIFIDEWKQEERLLRLSEKQSDRYVWDGKVWRSPILEEYFDADGLSYRLRSTSGIPHIRLQNLKFLSDFLDPASGETSALASQAIDSVFKESAEIPLPVLLKETQKNGSTFSSDDIYRAIAARHLYVDLDGALISDTNRTLVYRDEVSQRFLRDEVISNPAEGSYRLSKSLIPGSVIEFDGRTLEVALVGGTGVVIKDERGVSELTYGEVSNLFHAGKILLPDTPVQDDSSKSKFNSLNPDQMAEIEERRECIQKGDKPGAVQMRSERTLRRYRKAFREAGENILEQNLALVSRKAERGNRLPKIPMELIDLIEKIEKTRHNTPRAPTKEASYMDLCKACRAAGIRPCSKRTFFRRLRVSVLKREGTRRAYQVNPITWYLHNHEPVHGVRPFEIVHVDCTPLELVVRGPWDSESLGTVNLCLAMDAESRAVLAYHVTFEKPSARITMMVVRDLVRRHRRMPEILVVDHGPENNNQQLKRICSLCGTSMRMRPKGAARAGTVLERLFGSTQSQFIHQLDGNTKIRKHHRSVTKAVNPEQFSCWTLPALHGALEEHFNITYGEQIHPAHGEPPVEHLKRRMLATGARCNRMVPFDRLFLIETCPSPFDSETRKVDPIRGIKVDHIWYSSDEFRKHSVGGRKVQVRIDPWDPGVAFALVGKQWVECVSKYRSLFRHLSWVELRYVINELKQMNSAKKLPLSEARIAAFMRTLSPENFDLRLRIQQEEARLIYQGLGTAAVNGAADPNENPFKRWTPTLASKKKVGAPLPNGDDTPKSEIVLEAEIMSSVPKAPDWSFDDDFGLF